MQELNIMLLSSSVNTPFILAPAVRCILKMHLSHVPSVLRNHEGGDDVAVISDLLNLPFHFLGGSSPPHVLPAFAPHLFLCPLKSLSGHPLWNDCLSCLSFHKLRCWYPGTGVGLSNAAEDSDTNVVGSVKGGTGRVQKAPVRAPYLSLVVLHG